MDLRIYGDIAESYIELLRDKYGVNVSNFRFEKYFPEEIMGSSFKERTLFLLIPSLRKKAEQKIEYTPFTFRKIIDSIDLGYLI